MIRRALIALVVLAALSFPGANILEAQGGPRIDVTVSDYPESESGGGDFDAAQLIRMFQARTAALRGCAEQVARSGSVPIGVVPVTLTIGEDGQARYVIAGSTAVPVELSACVVRVATGFRFVPPPEGGSVTYTVNVTFSSDAPTPAPGPRGS